LSPQPDGNDDKERVTTAAPKKRLKREKAATGEERLTSASTHILDLSSKLLSKILHYTGNYKEITRLRAVCRRFDAVCCDVLLSGFFEIQVRLVSNTKKTHRITESLFL
jgi:hypothetical protein